MDELDIYQKQGFGNQSGFGHHPALLIVDFVNGFTDADQFGGGNIDARSRSRNPCWRRRAAPKFQWRSPASSMRTTRRTPAFSA
jgi:hypothetical protein